MSLKGKIKKYRQCLDNDLIYHDYYHKEIDDNLVYVESIDGTDFAGNILRIVEELSSGDYGNFKIFVYAQKNVHPKIKELQKNYNLKIDVLSSDELKATKTSERAKYIITDSAMRPKFVKRPEQVLLNTWHGTPLKTMGIDNQAEEHKCGDIQQVFFASDYLLCQNQFAKDKVLNAYMLEKIYPGTVLLGGNPRNSALFGENENLKDKLGYGNKTVFAYVSSFKDELTEKDSLCRYLNEIDERLNDNQILLVKSPFKFDFSNFKHVQNFPIGYETYDVLNITSCLVSDYSNIIFDYANTRKKIILFNFAEENYDTYLPMNDLPFSKVQSVDELIIELNDDKNYDETEFLKEYCPYDNENNVKNLCKHVFKGEKNLIEEKIVNDKKNILIFAGGLKKNGMTSSLANILYNVDKEKYNFFVCYSSWSPDLQKNHVESFKLMPEGIEYCPLRMSLNLTVREQREFVKFLKDPNKKLSEIVIKMLERELHRAFNGFPFDSIIHFNGYGIEETMLFSVSDAKKSIWVHNDMVQEIKSKANQNLSTLKYVYNKYDNVVVVSPDLIEPTSKISGRKDNIKVIHNVNDVKEIEQKGLKDIKINESCVVTTQNAAGIKGVLNSSGKKFITIGRFSPEKGHKRLIKAFNKYCEDYPDTQLIIIGSYGPSYDETIAFGQQSKFAKNITIIKSILNPMPILKQSDLFVVSSFYEGWPMVIMEADAFDIPIIATDITGTQWMKEYEGYIVENSEQGILKGMYDFAEGKVNALGIDYKKYNENAVDEFLKII